LELALKHHDWTFQYSDDYRVYKEGLDEETMIEGLMKQVGEPLATEMLKKYRE
jgi:hypothetical protein